MPILSLTAELKGEKDRERKKSRFDGRNEKGSNRGTGIEASIILVLWESSRKISYSKKFILFYEIHSD